MAGARFDMDGSQVQKRLKKFLAASGNLRPAMASIGEHMLNVTEERFRAEKSPAGAGWRALSPATKAQKKKNKDKILTEYGNLRRRIIYSAKKSSMAFGTNVKYAAIHQFGGKAGRGRKVTIPARPYLGFNQFDEAQAYQILRKYLEEQ